MSNNITSTELRRPPDGVARWALNKKVLFFATLIGLMVIPIAVGDDYIYHIFITICLFAGLSTAWNIVGGYAGQLSLGHAIYYGIGAYTGILMMHSGVSPWISMFVGALLAAGVAVAISYPCFKLHGPFYALASIAFLEVFHVVSLNWTGLTGGANGVMAPLELGWHTMIFMDRLPSLVIAFGLMCFVLAVAWAIRRSKLGFQLIATRERESAARGAAIRTVHVRLYAAAISAGLTSMLGTFHGSYLTYLDPESAFNLTFSIQIVLFALVGGLGTVFGPLYGTILLVPITELARGWLGSSAIGLHGFVYGVVLILVVLFMPDGIMSIIQRYLPTSRVRRFDTSVESPVDHVHLDDIKKPARPPTGEVILKVEHLDKHFGGLHVTNDVSFDLHKGEVLGIIGPNGAGKTTVFNMISGFLRPDSGTVAILGEDGQFMSPRTPRAFARSGVGRTFQIVQPFAAMTVEENIMVGAFYRFRSVEECRKAAREIAYELGLYRFLEEEARNLPIGGLKRLEVARVMAMRPRILLLDEVMAGINPADLREAIELIKVIRNSGISIIAIEHVMQAVMELSDRVIVISSGEILAQGKPEEVVKNEAVIEAYLGKEASDAATE
ncbi:branched-chain amino acid ABC transporter ATP-binding protein/permease [Halomonas meridiana]|uniref:branched-chain amino acid ABC transporter ATP-binding protein/permease n=1 Tax=Vreelandella aquamarina TaxID=77097 RepID=UPI001E2894D1|nr:MULTISPECIES: branched-chain amino acid ABC transporter ATP-binding protein/permease [Halomonas]MCD1652099.1 branched-chain amino acid ABC transporter ATP-binding protein/permease [Halomonas axialensis]MCD2088294.1 branched-chain amino acid ABC transporter ATP-binding protein/permease [Halomonas meridiana]